MPSEKINSPTGPINKFKVGSTVFYKGEECVIIEKNKPAGEENVYKLKVVGEDELNLPIELTEEMMEKEVSFPDINAWIPLKILEDEVAPVPGIKNAPINLTKLNPEEEIPISPAMVTMEKWRSVALDDARVKYAEGYKKFMKERRKGILGKFKSAKEFIFGGDVHNKNIPADLKILEEKYNAAARVLGNEMFDNGASKSEILERIVIEEQEELSKLKVENLPPREKGIILKSFDWYIKQPRWKKIAISTALATTVFAVVVPGTVAAAGGAATFAGVRAVRGVAGIAGAQISAKAVDWLFPDKSTKKRADAEKDLYEYFENYDDLSKEELEYAKEEYSFILEEERQKKRNRVLGKALVGLALGGAASFGAGFGMSRGISNGILEQTNNKINPDNADSAPSSGPTETPKTSQSPDITDNSPKDSSVPVEDFVNEGIKIERGGAIQAIKDLQEQLKTEHPDIAKAPQGIQDFVKANPTQKAIDLGFYDPTKEAESALIQKGSVLKFDSKGNLLFGKPGTDGNIAPLENKYSGKMLDSDKPKIVEEKMRVKKSTNMVDSIKIPKKLNVLDISDSKIPDKTSIITDATQTDIDRNTTKEELSETILDTKESISEQQKDLERNPASTPKPTPTATPEEIKIKELKNKIESDIRKSETESQTDNGEKVVETTKKPNAQAILERNPAIKGTPFENALDVPEKDLVEVVEMYTRNKNYINRGGINIWDSEKNKAVTDFIADEVRGNQKIANYINNAINIFNTKNIKLPSTTTQIGLLFRDKTADEYVAELLLEAKNRGFLAELKQ